MGAERPCMIDSLVLAVTMVRKNRPGVPKTMSGGTAGSHPHSNLFELMAIARMFCQCSRTEPKHNRRIGDEVSLRVLHASDPKPKRPIEHKIPN